MQGSCAQVHVSGINTCGIIEQVFIPDTMLPLKIFARNRQNENNHNSVDRRQCPAKYKLKCKSNNIRR